MCNNFKVEYKEIYLCRNADGRKNSSNRGIVQIHT